MKFSKNGIINLIEGFAERESHLNDPKWQRQKINVDGIEVYLKKGGSDVSADQPYMRSNCTFKSKFVMSKFVSAMYDPVDVFDWEKNTKTLEVRRINNKKSYFLNYFVTKKVMTVNSRDFCDKQIMFAANGKIYKYSGYIPDANSFLAPVSGIVRGKNLFSCCVCSRTEDNSILFININ